MKIAIYIDGEKVDLFEDESINVNQSIKNIRDVSKTFTTFTQSFKVPASKTNNKIFKHYYNFDIVGGFDARKRVDSIIEINSMPFQYGKIKLENVDLQNNKPISYSITFYGRTVDLKDILGEDKLQVLSPLNTHSLSYDAATVRTNLQTAIGVKDIIAPLITHTDRLYYDSSVTGGSDGNLYYDAASTLQGVLWTQLKYAIRVHTIVEAIETYYGITFSDDFLDSTQTDYYDLFMWLHRVKGDVSNGTQIPTFPYLVSDWTNAVGSTGAAIEYTEELVIPTGIGANLIANQLDIQTASGATYEITIMKDGVFFYGATGLTGNNTFDATDFVLIDGRYTLTITSDSAITFTVCEWEVEDETNVDTFDTGTFSTSVVFDFQITAQIPDIKVIDFLTGLFKMFNLITYVNDSGTYVVDTLDNFYGAGIDYDISQYVDVSKSSVGVSLPYKEVVFKYDDTSTFFAENHLQLFNYEWGTEEYKDNEKLDGDTYTLSVPFNHSKYERLIDLNTSTNTDIQWGYFTDDNGDSYVGSPLLFYPILITGTAISYRQTATTHQSLPSYIIPSNSQSVTSASQNINFKKELNEYNSGTDYPATLFQTYYSNYIGDVFNIRNRLTKIKAYLPLKVLLNYNLSDRFIVNGYKYKINNINTNLLTGESSIELLNEL